MNWDKAYVRSKYGSSYLGQEFIFFPAKNCKRLLVFFSSMGKDKYDRYSWFWEENENWNETAFLFIKDDSFQYFLGNDDRPLKDTFRKIIQFKAEELGLKSNRQVFAIGASMGGYAAIFYASYMQLGGAITANPQMDYKSARKHNFENWERSIRSTGTQWYDLGDFVQKRPVPNIYIEHGNYVADRAAVEKFYKSILGSESNIFISNRGWSGHSVDGLFKGTIEAMVALFESLNSLESQYNIIK